MSKSSLLYIWKRLLRVAPLAIGMLVLFMGKPSAARPVYVGAPGSQCCDGGGRLTIYQPNPTQATGF
jgi:hypothetical protein